MRRDELSSDEKTRQLAQDLNHYHRTTLFDRCRSMGDLVRQNLKLMLLK